jgi:hypothetical protein
VVIAHRLSSVIWCDRVVVMDRGQVTEVCVRAEGVLRVYPRVHADAPRRRSPNVFCRPIPASADAQNGDPLALFDNENSAFRDMCDKQVSKDKQS